MGQKIEDSPQRPSFLESVPETIPVPVTKGVLAIWLTLLAGRSYGSLVVLDTVIGMRVLHDSVDRVFVVALVEGVAISIVYGAFAEIAFVRHCKVSMNFWSSNVCVIVVGVRN
jgi:hypothetical protein